MFNWQLCSTRLSMFHNNLSTHISNTESKDSSASSVIKTLTLEDTIKLPSDCVPLSVHMLEDPGKVLICREDENAFLFTSGLGPCIAAMFFCKLKSGYNLIALAHISMTPINKIRDIINGKTEIETAVKYPFGQPEKVIALLYAIINSKDYQGELINVYFAGGQGSKYDRELHQLYCSYIPGLKVRGLNVELSGVLFNPFDIDPDIDRRFKGISTTAGITSSGIPVVSKSINISTDEFKACLDEDALKRHFIKRNLVYRERWAEDEDIIYGFNNLTYKKLKEFECCFCHDGFFYERNEKFTKKDVYQLPNSGLPVSSSDASSVSRNASMGALDLELEEVKENGAKCLKITEAQATSTNKIEADSYVLGKRKEGLSERRESKKEEIELHKQNLLCLLGEVLALKGHEEKDGEQYEKYRLLWSLQRKISSANFDTLEEVKIAAKQVFVLCLQKNKSDLTNTTKSGKKIRELLNSDKCRPLKLLLFPTQTAVRYRDLVSNTGASTVKFFSSSTVHKRTMYGFYSAHKDTLLKQEEITDLVTGKVKLKNK